MSALDSPIATPVIGKGRTIRRLIPCLALILTACVAPEAEGKVPPTPSKAETATADPSGRRPPSDRPTTDRPAFDRPSSDRQENARRAVRDQRRSGRAHRDFKLPTASIDVLTTRGGSHRVTVEIAADDHSRSVGLMHRESLAQNEGMLFVFDRDAIQTFWMRNTLIPLDMLFVAVDGTIVGIVHEAPPLTETPRFVDKPSRYVLEVPGGWSVARDVRAGDRVDIDAALDVLGRRVAK